ncbi:hypothetical protein PG279_07095 [Riemerella anatipestifer]|nr:hypothetical protein [Riemerella anatipestifer]
MKSKYIISLLGILLFLSPLFLMGQPTPPATGGGSEGAGFDVGAKPTTPIDIYSPWLLLVAVGLMLVASYYLRKKQLKSL